MPSFHDSTDTQAPAEEVWKLLYDPARFPDWWAGIATVEVAETRAGEAGEFTMYPDGYPDFPMAQLLDTHSDSNGVTVSCLVSDLRFEWHLQPLEDGRSTRISVDVEIPEKEAERLESQRHTIRASLSSLAQLAALGAG
jgi:Polyketide cyclase / dehydrase and lipid transport